MARTVADFLVERLNAWGVRRIFGYPGDGINGIMGALQRSGDVEFVLARHEEMAAFMACGHAKYTGEVGVCLATSGPGAIHLLNGLYDAQLDHAPVVAIVGQQARAAMGGQYQQEVDLLALFKDVAREYAQMATTPAQIRHLVDRAVRVALSERSVTCVIIPHDLQEMPAVTEPKLLVTDSSRTATRGVGAPSRAVLSGSAGTMATLSGEFVRSRTLRGRISWRQARHGYETDRVARPGGRGCCAARVSSGRWSRRLRSQGVVRPQVAEVAQQPSHETL